jgi:hypothetical protein
MHHWSAWPVATVCEQYPLAPEDEQFKQSFNHVFSPTPGVFFDVYPVADDRLMLFILDGDTMQARSGTGKQDKNPYYSVTMEWTARKDAERFKSPFKEAFTVFVRDKDYYFVTEYGDVFLARPEAARNEERKVEKIWDGRRQPVHALITDAATDKVYCFVKPFFTDKQDEERVYFELAAKPDPRPYKLTKIDKPKIDESLKSVLEYAHVLQKDKRIK